ncbi:phage tail protein [Bacillus vallismortis]|uniref:major tail protein n=1 Tax=Bacillus vallismortis TaxID=72361 RepID=UPI0010AB333C|nr:major tail protein [Bacillus vallismortis]MEC1270809.1 phage tail protein [Bacillus vallismortis]TII14756.1 major tail protein [Bacillus subtilis]
MARIGMTDLRYAVVDGETEKVDTVKRIRGAQSAKLDVTSETEKIYADDGVFAVIGSGISEAKLELGMADLKTEDRTKILGVNVVDGIEEYHKDTNPPYVCVTWKEKHHDKGYVYYALLKGKFAIPSSEGKSKEDKISAQTDSIEGQFMPRQKDDLVFLVAHDQHPDFTVEKFYQKAYGITVTETQTTEDTVMA